MTFLKHPRPFVKYITALLFAAGSCCANAQVTPGLLKKYIMDNSASLNPDAIALYANIKYQAMWLNKNNAAAFRTFYEALQNCDAAGLNREDYHFSFIDSVYKGAAGLHNSDDSVKAEINIANAAIIFYSHIAYGNVQPAFGYNGLSYGPSCMQVPVLLAAFATNNALSLLPRRVAPAIPEVQVMEKRVAWLVKIIKENSFKEITIISSKEGTANKPLMIKLYQLGITDSSCNNFSGSIVKEKIKEAQKQFDLDADGSLNAATLQQLNVPLAQRLQQLSLSLNYYRWLGCLAQNQSVIVVNIPAAYLKVYRNNKVILEMRVIAGKTSTPTAAIAGTINNVILYPYWHVPYSIATKELLPKIKRNPGYLDANNYQVIDGNGKVINPYSVNWYAFSSRYFPYLIRQGTGCDNALGLLKLDFYNPFGMYLHDTPGKNLFTHNKRFYSHGCMRMEKPMELGHLVLKNNSVAIDTLDEKGCLRNQQPVIVPADEHIPVIVWYNPAGIDSAGRIIYYEDVYGKFKWGL